LNGLQQLVTQLQTSNRWSPLAQLEAAIGSELEYPIIQTSVEKPDMRDRQAPIPLHKEMSSYAMRFAKAIFIGELPLSRGGPIASATMTLLRFDQLYLGVTCHHVLAHYRQLKQAGANLIFQIGSVQLDPLLQLIDEDPKRDLVTLDLTVCKDEVQRSEDSNFVEPHSWPPGAVSERRCDLPRGLPWHLARSVEPSRTSVSFFQFRCKSGTSVWRRTFCDTSSL